MSVVVLTPNGRRQNVKVTPNTTILQVLEEVCRKHGYKPEEYDIKHHNKILDATSIIRYAGLPNNAQLEMAVALKIRAESEVKVGLALENGRRIMGEFEPSDCLWHVVEKLCPDEAASDESTATLPVIFYLGREESGIENLRKTTLRSLGLTSGGGILRYFRKAPGELNQQANVSAPLTRPVPSQEPVLKVPSCSSASKKSPNAIYQNPPIDTQAHTFSQQAVESERIQLEPQVYSEPERTSIRKDDEEKMSLMMSNENISSQSADMEVDCESSSETPTEITVSSSVSSNNEEKCHSQPTESEPCNNDVEETIVFLGERNAVLFDLATSRACQPEDVPDDFFDLTVDDAKQLLRDLKRRQAALEEQPLVTSQYRELEKSKHMLNALSHYKRCVVKVQFPNQLVLQGTFTPLEKVSHVLDFVRKYLQDPTIDFDIFITPPKTILLAEQTLYDANCVPGALVYFSSNSSSVNGSYIREDIMARATTVSAAVAAAYSCRSKNVAPTNIYNPEPQPTSSNTAKTRTVVTSSTTPTASSGETSSDKKVPKWFKSTNK